jgi:membrane-associated phospholipid phosphatase
MAGSKKAPWMLAASYVFDWIILIIVGIVGLVLNNITPNKRPFNLEDPNISFPYTEDETVPFWIAGLVNTAVPVVVIAIIALVFVPGATVPKGVPRSLIWKRKLWELHQGWLGLALSCAAAWLITNGMKNMLGKPRPDLLARCQPDIANLSQYIVGGIANSSSNGQLVSGNICKNPDKDVLDDGFRSCPSGHSSSSAAGLLYLSLFIASKFAITIPFLAPSGYSEDHTSHSAFPSRMNTFAGPGLDGVESFELSDHHPTLTGTETLTNPHDPALKSRLASHAKHVAAARRQAASAPLYLLLICVLPFFAAVFIASSRWFDFRHHGFDIIFGFLIGTVTAVFSFRYYHLPIGRGAGWAWGPRSQDKAFWAGVGSYSFATNIAPMRDQFPGFHQPGDEEEGLGGGGPMVSTAMGSGRRLSPGRDGERALGRKTSRGESLPPGQAF